MSLKNKSNFNKECPICFDDLSTTKKNCKFEFSCGHSFHKQCFKNVLKTECPCCRKDIRKEIPITLIKKIKKNKDSEDNENFFEYLSNEQATSITFAILEDAGYTGYEYLTNNMTDDLTGKQIIERVEIMSNYYIGEAIKGLNSN